MGGFQNIAIISEKEKKVPSIFSLTLELVHMSDGQST